MTVCRSIHVAANGIISFFLYDLSNTNIARIHNEKGFNSARMSHHNFINDVSGCEPVMFCNKDRDFTFSEIQRLGMEEGSIIKNPELTENYNIDEDSELLNFGFKKIRNLIINRS